MNSIGKLLPLLDLMRVQLLQEHITGIAITSEAWKSGILHLSDEQQVALKQQAETFIRSLS